MLSLHRPRLQRHGSPKPMQQELSLQRQNSEIKRLQQSYRRINAERREAAKRGATAPVGGSGAITGGLMGLGTGALAGAGIGAAAYGAYSWGKRLLQHRKSVVKLYNVRSWAGWITTFCRHFRSMPRLTVLIPVWEFKDNVSYWTRERRLRKAGRQLHQQHL